MREDRSSASEWNTSAIKSFVRIDQQQQHSQPTVVVRITTSTDSVYDLVGPADEKRQLATLHRFCDMTKCRPAIELEMALSCEDPFGILERYSPFGTDLRSLASSEYRWRFPQVVPSDAADDYELIQDCQQLVTYNGDKFVYATWSIEQAIRFRLHQFGFVDFDVIPVGFGVARNYDIWMFNKESSPQEDNTAATTTTKVLNLVVAGFHHHSFRDFEHTTDTEAASLEPDFTFIVEEIRAMGRILFGRYLMVGDNNNNNNNSGQGQRLGPLSVLVLVRDLHRIDFGFALPVNGTKLPIPGCCKSFVK